MQAASIICATLVALATAVEYSYSPLSNGAPVGQCQFQASASNYGEYLCQQEYIERDDFTQGGDLTWEILTDACPELVYAGCADPDWQQGAEHNMTRDLVWDDDSCGSCPRCPCLINGTDVLYQFANFDTENITYYIRNYTTISTTSAFQVSSCIMCECEAYNYLYTNSTLGRNFYQFAYDCSTAYTYNSPEELEQVRCPYDLTTAPTMEPTLPPTGGCNDGWGNVKVPGEYFFYYDAENCTTYCTCNTTNGLDCEQGWDNIMAREDMKQEFLNDCDSYIEDAWDDTSRWEKWFSCSSSSFYDGPYYNCPINTCGDYKVNEMWNATERVYNSININGTLTEYYYCVECTCNSNTTTAFSTVTCDVKDYSTVQEEAECYEKEEKQRYMNCSDSYDAEDDEYGTDTCAIPQYYCGWSKSDLPKGFDPDTVCVIDDLEDNGIGGGTYYGCLQDEYCIAVFGYKALNESETGFCSYNEVSFTAKEYDCLNFEWKSETYTIEQNLMCCGKAAGDSCNSQVPSKDGLGKGKNKQKCESKGVVSELLKADYECKYGDKGVTNNDYIKQLKCNVPLPEASNVESRVCDLIENRWKWDTTCECQQYQALEKALGNSDYEDEIRAELQATFDGNWWSLVADLEVWNLAYDCGKTFECDVYDSSVNKIKMSFLSVIFIFFVNYYL